MLNAEEIRALIVCRLAATEKSYCSEHAMACNGQVRALLAVLNGVPPPGLTEDIVLTLEAAGIPYVLLDGDMVDFDEAWLLAHGFVIDLDDPAKISHPVFSQDW